MEKQKGSASISTLSIVQMNDVSASYDSKNYVLKNVQMSITRGANYAIVGESGSGKSTLLKLINGMMNHYCSKIHCRLCFCQNIHDLSCGHMIQLGNNFVCKNNFWFLNKSPCYCNSSLFSTTKHVDLPLSFPLKTN